MLSICTHSKPESSRCAAGIWFPAGGATHEVDLASVESTCAGALETGKRILDENLYG